MVWSIRLEKECPKKESTIKLTNDASTVSDLMAPSTDTGVVTASSTTDSTVTASAAAMDVNPIVWRRTNWGSSEAFPKLLEAAL